MTIRRKILLVIGLTLISLLISLHFVSSLVLRSGFAHVEEQEAKEDVSRVRAALDDMTTKINSTAGDWAWWDDTYRYVTDKNPIYERANLSSGSISNLHINYMAMVNPAGKIIFGTGFDLAKNTRTPLSSYFLRELNRKNSPLYRFSSLQGSTQGLMMLPSGPVLVASRAILRSSKKGPRHGTLILGRDLNDKEIKNLSALTRFPVEMQLFKSSKTEGTNSKLSSDFNLVRSELSQSNPIAIQVASNEELWGYALVDNIYAKPALIMRVAMPRSVHRQGEQTLRYMLASLLVACSLFCGVIFWLLKRVVLVRLESLNDNVRHITINSDLTERVRESGRDELGTLAIGINELLENIQHSQENLQESETRFRTFMDNSPAVAFIKDAEGHMVYVNSTFEKCFQKKRADVIGKTDLELWPAEIAHHLREHDLTVIRTGEALQVEEAVLISDHKITDWLTFKFPLIGRNGEISVAGMGIDITQRKRMEAQLTEEQKNLAVANSQLEGLNKLLEQQAMRDELTQLANRRAFNQKLEKEMAKANESGLPLSLLLLDIDKFKVVNDTWGHSYGDEVLKEVAVLLQKALRNDDFSARYGGEEMVVILPNTSADGALRIAERCRQYIEGGTWAHGSITASFGASTFRTGMEGAAFVAAADAALYVSKKKGRNRSTHAFQIGSLLEEVK